jgi:hypothetical protein
MDVFIVQCCVLNSIIDKGKDLIHGVVNFSTEFVGCFCILFQSQKPGGEAGTFTVAELVSKPVSTAVSIRQCNSVTFYF